MEVLENAVDVLKHKEVIRPYKLFQNYYFDNYLEIKEQDYFSSENEAQHVMNYLTKFWNETLDTDTRRSFDNLTDEELLAEFEDFGIDFDWVYFIVQKEISPIRKNKIGRNESCPCGSGNKYKKCCIGKKELEVVTENDTAMFYKYIVDSILLIMCPEFEGFGFDIDLNAEYMKPIAEFLNKETEPSSDFVKRFDALAENALRTLFTQEKKLELINVLNEIEKSDYTSQKTMNIIRAVRFFLEDEKANHLKLPLLGVILLGDVRYKMGLEK